MVVHQWDVLACSFEKKFLRRLHHWLVNAKEPLVLDSFELLFSSFIWPIAVFMDFSNKDWAAFQTNVDSWEKRFQLPLLFIGWAFLGSQSGWKLNQSLQAVKTVRYIMGLCPNRDKSSIMEYQTASPLAQLLATLQWYQVVCSKLWTKTKGCKRTSEFLTAGPSGRHWHSPLPPEHGVAFQQLRGKHTVFPKWHPEKTCVKQIWKSIINVGASCFLLRSRSLWSFFSSLRWSPLRSSRNMEALAWRFQKGNSNQAAIAMGSHVILALAVKGQKTGRDLEVLRKWWIEEFKEQKEIPSFWKAHPFTSSFPRD